jgi:hypothetical protein
MGAEVGRREGFREGYRAAFAEGVREGLRLAFEGVVERPLFRIPPEDPASRDYREEGRKQGRLEGYRDGLLRGARDDAEKRLLKLLGKRFGEPPDWVASQVRSASDADIERWTDRILDASSVKDVFADD